MKKLLSFALVALMVISSVVPAFAVSLTDVPAAADDTIDVWVGNAEIGENNQATVTVSLANNVGFWSLYTYLVYPKCLTIDGNVKPYVQEGTSIIERSGDFYVGNDGVERTWIDENFGEALLASGVDISAELAKVAEMVNNDPDCLKAKESAESLPAGLIAAEKIAWGKLGYDGKADCAWEKAYGFEKYNCIGQIMVTYESSLYEEFPAIDGALYEVTFTYDPSLNTEGLEELEIVVLSDPGNQLHKFDEAGQDSFDVRLHNGVVTVDEEEEPSILYGDVNGDGKITNTDSLMLMRYLSNLDPITGESTIKVQAGADVNGDGKLTNTDSLMLMRYLSNLDPITGESSIKLGPRN